MSVNDTGDTFPGMGDDARQAGADDSADAPCIVIGGTDHQVRPLAGRSHWTIGRATGCDIVVADPHLSRRHLMIQRIAEGGGIYAIDLGSRNGVFVNGRRIQAPHRIGPSDLISIGQTTIQLQGERKADAFNQTCVTAAPATLVHQERKVVTILLVDIRNSTVLTRTLGETRAAEIIAPLLRRMGDLAGSHGSSLENYLGDGLMAVWFHTAASEFGQPYRSVLTALREIKKMVLSENSDQLPVQLTIRAAINTGYAASTTYDGQYRRESAIIGDTINAAFRLESASKQLGADVILGRDAYEAISALPGSDAPMTHAEVELKGYEAPVPVWTCSFEDLEARLDDSTRPSSM